MEESNLPSNNREGVDKEQGIECPKEKIDDETLWSGRNMGVSVEEFGEEKIYALTPEAKIWAKERVAKLKIRRENSEKQENELSVSSHVSNFENYIEEENINNETNQNYANEILDGNSENKTNTSDTHNCAYPVQDNNNEIQINEINEYLLDENETYEKQNNLSVATSTDEPSNEDYSTSFLNFLKSISPESSLQLKRIEEKINSCQNMKVVNVMKKEATGSKTTSVEDASSNPKGEQNNPCHRMDIENGRGNDVKKSNEISAAGISESIKRFRNFDLSLDSDTMDFVDQVIEKESEESDDESEATKNIGRYHSADDIISIINSDTENYSSIDCERYCYSLPAYINTGKLTDTSGSTTSLQEYVACSSEEHQKEEKQRENCTTKGYRQGEESAMLETQGDEYKSDIELQSDESISEVETERTGFANEVENSKNNKIEKPNDDFTNETVKQGVQSTNKIEEPEDEWNASSVSIAKKKERSFIEEEHRILVDNIDNPECCESNGLCMKEAGQAVGDSQKCISNRITEDKCKTTTLVDTIEDIEESKYISNYTSMILYDNKAHYVTQPTSVTKCEIFSSECTQKMTDCTTESLQPSDENHGINKLDSVLEKIDTYNRSYYGKSSIEKCSAAYPVPLSTIEEMNLLSNLLCGGEKSNIAEPNFECNDFCAIEPLCNVPQNSRHALLTIKGNQTINPLNINQAPDNGDIKISQLDEDKISILKLPDGSCVGQTNGASSKIAWSSLEEENEIQSQDMEIKSQSSGSENHVFHRRRVSNTLVTMGIDYSYQNSASGKNETSTATNRSKSPATSFITEETFVVIYK